MGLFDKMKQAASAAGGNQTVTFTFQELPESLAQMQALPEASLDTPFKTAALTVCALCAYGADKNIGKEMLNWLRGPRPLNGQDQDKNSSKDLLPCHFPASAIDHSTENDDCNRYEQFCPMDGTKQRECAVICPALCLYRLHRLPEIFHRNPPFLRFHFTIKLYHGNRIGETVLWSNPCEIRVQLISGRNAHWPDKLPHRTVLGSPPHRHRASDGHSYRPAAVHGHCCYRPASY